jgi:pimeloyl-ACP methyl ester carboxylesterase
MTSVPWQARKPSSKARLLAWLLLINPVFVAALYPFAQEYVQAASLLERVSDPRASGWIANHDVHPIEVRDTTFDFRGKALPSRTYLPRGVGFAPGIVVVHGMHELGIDEPRLVNFARALAGSGFFVMTPLVPGIADYRVESVSADVIGTAVQSFAEELSVPRVGVLAISFSGGLALLAAGDPQYARSFAWVASVGGYYDLAHVLRFFANGDAVRPDGTVEHHAPHEYGPLIVIYDEPADFFPPQDASLAHESLKLLLAGKGEESERLTAKMSPSGQRVMQDIYHKQRQTLAPAILAEVDKQQDDLAAASPAGHLRFIQVPVLLLHGSDDTIIPPTELLWLKHDIPEEYLAGALVTPAISHVEVGKPSWREEFALLHWVVQMLRLARRTSGGTPVHAPAGEWVAVLPQG